MQFNRRQFLAAALGGPAYADAVKRWNRQVRAGTGLIKKAASARGILFGAGVGQLQLANDPAFARMFAEECAVLTPHSELKWVHTRPSPTSFNFDLPDKLLQYAEANHLKMRGHPLIWHGAMPSWFEGYINKQNARSLLENHIRTTMSHYKGKVVSWDVVNEIIWPSDHMEEGFRNTAWYKNLGGDYVSMAFHAAHQTDPAADLCWNDNHLEDDTAFGETKRRQTLDLLKRLVQQKVPIQTLGLQAHLSEKNSKPAASTADFLKGVQDLGIRIILTELDVLDVESTPDRDKEVADLYFSNLSFYLKYANPKTIVTWELFDKGNWLDEEKDFRRKDGQPHRPAVMDADLRPKQAYDAVLAALQQTS